MVSQRGFCLRELGATIVAASLAGAILLGLAPEPTGPSPRTFENLRYISQAAHIYRLDHNGYLPIVLSYAHRGSAPRPGNQMFGWNTWAFGGKNNSAWWYDSAMYGFDVEAADRPLNPYILPEEPFYAPPFPERLPANDPHRTSQQAEMFRDPGDVASYVRAWPAPVPGVSGYDDVGTSYMTNIAWWYQLFQISNFVNRFNEGARRIAAGEGVDPARFVWLSDHIADVLVNHHNRNLRLRNGYGDWNHVPMLFMDGHADYQMVKPTVQSTTRYTFRFE